MRGIDLILSVVVVSCPVFTAAQLGKIVDPQLQSKIRLPEQSGYESPMNEAADSRKFYERTSQAERCMKPVRADCQPQSLRFRNCQNGRSCRGA